MHGHLHGLLHAHSILECMPTTSFSALQFPLPKYPLLHALSGTKCSVCSVRLLLRTVYLLQDAYDMRGLALEIATVAAEAMKMEHEHQDEPKEWSTYEHEEQQFYALWESLWDTCGTVHHVPQSTPPLLQLSLTKNLPHPLHDNQRSRSTHIHTKPQLLKAGDVHSNNMQYIMRSSKSCNLKSCGIWEYPTSLHKYEREVSSYFIFFNLVEI